MKTVFKKSVFMMLCGCLLAGCVLLEDMNVSFARRFWNLFMEGNQEAIAMVDWSKAVFFNNDIAKTYNALPGQEQKTMFAKNLMESFSRGFQYLKSMTDKKITFFNWRLVKSESKEKVVAVNVNDQQRIIFFFVSTEGGVKKITGIQGQAPNFSYEIVDKLTDTLVASRSKEEFSEKLKELGSAQEQGAQNAKSE